MSTRIFCDLCNSVLPSVPPRMVKTVSVIKNEDHLSDPSAKPTVLQTMTELSGDFCPKCKDRIIRSSMTSEEYEQKNIVRFGGTK